MKGRPILGVTTGFLFGLFLGVTLFLYGVIPLSSDLLWILPLLGVLLGLIMAAWAPFGMSVEPVPPPSTAPTPAPAPVAATVDEGADVATGEPPAGPTTGDDQPTDDGGMPEPTAG